MPFSPPAAFSFSSTMRRIACGVNRVSRAATDPVSGDKIRWEKGLANSSSKAVRLSARASSARSRIATGPATGA